MHAQSPGRGQRADFVEQQRKAADRERGRDHPLVDREPQPAQRRDRAWPARAQFRRVAWSSRQARPTSRGRPRRTVNRAQSSRPPRLRRDAADVDDGFRSRPHAEQRADAHETEEPARQPRERAERNVARASRPSATTPASDAEHRPRRRDRQRSSRARSRARSFGSRPQAGGSPSRAGTSRRNVISVGSRPCLGARRSAHVMASATGSSRSSRRCRPRSSSTTRSTSPGGRSRSCATMTSAMPCVAADAGEHGFELCASLRVEPGEGLVEEDHAAGAPRAHRRGRPGASGRRSARRSVRSRTPAGRGRRRRARCAPRWRRRPRRRAPRRAPSAAAAAAARAGTRAPRVPSTRTVPSLGCSESRDDPGQRRLARAVVPDDEHRFVFADRRGRRPRAPGSPTASTANRCDRRRRAR